MRAEKFSWIGLLAFALCASLVAFANPPAVADEDIPEFAESRVARITVVRGDVQIRRAGKKEWEEAAPNVPLLEGDRLATGENSRAEIQFGFRSHMRVDEYSLLKFVTLRPTGVAVSLPEGSLNLRITEFNPSREYFEIDAPKTTVAVKRAGLYRVDAPRERDDRDVKVTVTGGGEARVYTEANGFTIRNGRMARIFTEGSYAGDFELTAARSFSDDFDRWSAEREDVLARRRYETRSYYDSSIYGAEELEDHGEWIYTNDYGYIWRPSSASLAGYRNWSPYRYGHWRYLSRYGWTWIAAEPWGWATSHYGRWVWVQNGWAWCPYDSRRSRRVYWQPSLAIFVNYGNNYYWCPMPYRYGYRYRKNRTRTIIQHTVVVINNQTTTATVPATDPTPNFDPNVKHSIKDIPDVYVKAMTTTSGGEIIAASDDVVPVQPNTVRDLLQKSVIVADDQKLPEPVKMTPVTVSKDREIVATKRAVFADAENNLETGKIGADKRESGVQLDEKLKTERVFSNRPPAVREPQTEENPDRKQSSDPFKTGVFDRKNETPSPRSDEGDVNNEVVRPTPRSQKRDSEESDENVRPVFAPRKQRDDNDSPTPREDKSREEKRRQEKYDNDDRKENRQPRYEPPQPSYDPPPRREETKREEPRYEPPPSRPEPRPEPPPKQRDDPPPQRKEDAAPPPPSKSPDRDNR